MFKGYEKPLESESRFDMNKKEIMQLMQGLKYIGEEELSATQLKKSRKEEANKFFDKVKNLPQWQDRIEELWGYYGDQTKWKLEIQTKKELS
jgi:hypothetical protein